MCEESIFKLGHIAGELKSGDFCFRNSLYFAASKKDVHFLKNEYLIRKYGNFKVTWLEENEIRQHYRLRAPAAILSETGAEIDVYSFTHAIHQYSIKKKLKVFDRTPVTKIEHKKNNVVLETANGHVIQAKHLVYAIGYEVVNLISKKVVKLRSTYAVASEQLNDNVKLWEGKSLLWNTSNPYLYMRTTTDNRIIIGGADENFYNPVARDKLIQKKTERLSKDFNSLLPHIPFIPEFSWAGTFGSTDDGLPFIGSYKKLPNSFFALGFGGNGITFSLVAAEIITDLILGKKNNDVKLFSFERM